MFGSNSGLAGDGPSPFATAYLYGEAANLLDYDETLAGHPGAAVVGAVLSIAAREGLSFDRLLRGIAAGYEVHWLLAAAASPTPARGSQVRSVGVWDTVAASIGCGVALGLDEEMLDRVLGLAVAHSLLPYTGKWYERPVPSLKNNLGWAGAGAVMALSLAQAGKTGVTSALDGETGMWRMAGSDRWSFDDKLSEPPAVLRVGFKRYPACWHLQAYLTTFSRLLSSLELCEEIVEILVAGPASVEKFCRPEIVAPTDTAFSLPAAFSLLIERVEPGPIWASFADDARVLRHRDLFRYAASDAHSIVIRTASGRAVDAMLTEAGPVDLSSGGLDEAGVLAKFHALADPALRRGAERLVAANSAGTEDAAPLYAAFREMMRELVS
jgi:hypothetical protein